MNVYMLCKQYLSDIIKACCNIWQSFSFRNKVILITLLGILLQIPLLSFTNAEHDEQYTMLLFQYSWKDMLKTIMSEDGHPPLSYIYQRLWSLGIWNNIFMLHMSSLFVLLMMVLLGCYPIRRLCGDKVALIFIFLTFAMPSSFRMASNMRMYPLAVFFITGVFVYSQNILLKYRKSDWIFLTLFSILGMYTYYYCVIYSAIIWLLLLYNLIISKQYKQLKNFFISGTCVALLYLPWLYVFFSQFNYMKEKWYPSFHQAIEALNGLLFMFYIYDSKSVEYLALLVTTILGIYCWILIFQMLFDKVTNKINHMVVKNFVIITVIFIVCTLFITMYVRPMLETRYIFIQIGMNCLAIACSILKYPKFRKIFYSILLISFVVIFYQFRYISKDTGFQRLTSYIRKIAPEDSLIIYNNSNTHLILKYYLPEYKIAYAPIYPAIILFRDEVLQEKQNLLNIEKFDKIYYLSTYETIEQSSICHAHFSNKFDTHGVSCFSRLTLKQAKRIIRKAQKTMDY